ncbi:hypothetical protein RHMOL_Rhmol09G0155400 [Rhododendron molle]|uniref:Uncharacterized protein n=1 Tax=Rhododendron molle TaxID=49168 RepID=A0ACC0MEW5_RHOML|nr:hypothetical protein RHMOL_Rhmol09G0155400 [Rhododendron molle]
MFSLFSRILGLGKLKFCMFAIALNPSSLLVLGGSACTDGFLLAKMALCFGRLEKGLGNDKSGCMVEGQTVAIANSPVDPSDEDC